MRHCVLVLTLTLIGALASACANRPPDEGGKWQKLNYDGLPRTYLVHLPPVQDDGEALPLVILLHGGGSDGRDAARVSGMSAVADRAGFIAVYPNGTGRRPGVRTWNATHCCGYAMLNGIDDVGFLGALIKQLQRDYPVDPRRTYVAGMSNGGMLAHRAAVAYSNRIAGVGAVGAALFGEEPRPRNPVAAILINGMADQHVPFEGGLSRRAVSRSNMTKEMKPAGYAATFWARANGCAEPPGQSVEGTVERRIYDGCADGAEVAFYVLRDGEHAWPGGEKWRPGSDEPSRAINATEVIWDFFARHPKP